MKNFLKILVLTVLMFDTIVESSLEPKSFTKVTYHRSPRGIRDWNPFAKHGTPKPSSTTVPPKLPNNLDIGECVDNDKIIYVDDTSVKANNSTLNGVIEIYIDSEYDITCIKVLDQMPVGTGAMPSYNSGGQGHKFVFIDVQGQYGYGIHFTIIVRGKLKTELEKKSVKV